MDYQSRGFANFLYLKISSLACFLSGGDQILHKWLVCLSARVNPRTLFQLIQGQACIGHPRPHQLLTQANYTLYIDEGWRHLTSHPRVFLTGWELQAINPLKECLYRVVKDYWELWVLESLGALVGHWPNRPLCGFLGLGEPFTCVFT